MYIYDEWILNNDPNEYCVMLKFKSDLVLIDSIDSSNWTMKHYLLYANCSYLKIQRIKWTKGKATYMTKLALCHEWTNWKNLELWKGWPILVISFFSLNTPSKSRTAEQGYEYAHQVTPYTQFSKNKWKLLHIVEKCTYMYSPSFF